MGLTGWMGICATDSVREVVCKCVATRIPGRQCEAKGRSLNELKIFVAEVENAFYIGIDVHLGQRTGRTAELQMGLIEVVQVKMGVAGGVNKFAGLQISYLGHHLQQKGIAGYVEGYAEGGIRPNADKAEVTTFLRPHKTGKAGGTGGGSCG